MRKQFLWARRPGFHYLAPGNINFGAGDTGSISFWYHYALRDPDSNLWRLEVDSSNFAEIRWDPAVVQGRLEFRVVSDGAEYRVYTENGLFGVSDVKRWWLVTATWDFTTSDAGVLRLYFDTYDAADTLTCTSANPPSGTPSKFYIGNRSTANGSGACFDQVAIFDEVMGEADHLARLNGAPTDDRKQRNYARRAGADIDGFDGTLLFHGDFNEGFDARIASGDATAYWDVAEENYDEFALIDDGTRHPGRRIMVPMGLPENDLRDDDRVPGEAVLEEETFHDAGDYTTIENDDDCSRVIVSQDSGTDGVGSGRGWLWPWLQPTDKMQGPMTLRMRVNMPDGTNPTGYWTALGPLAYYNGGMHGGLFGDWGTGISGEVVDDAGNTATTFKTTWSLSDEWVGAELSVITGNCAPARLKIAGYDASANTVTVDGALPAVPDAGSQIVADHRGRLCAFDADGVLETQNMEAWLWEEYAGDRPWIELECQIDSYGSHMRVVRYLRGRTQMMDFTRDRTTGAARNGAMFGKSGDFGDGAGYSAEIRIESIEVDGPGEYQCLPSDDSRYGKACAPRDSFMVKDPETGESTRIWRAAGVSWGLTRPTKFSDPSQVKADMCKAGTWRDNGGAVSIVYPRESDEEVTALFIGTDPDGVQRLGYCVGTFDGERMSWEDETPPAGAENPFIERSELLPRARSDSYWSAEASGSAGDLQVFETPDGSWSMKYAGSELDPDYYITRVLHGSADRWSFSYDEHFWPENPICPGIGGVDKLPPEWSGVNQWANRDSEYSIAYNPYATRSEDRYFGYARGKTILPGSSIGENVRPLIGFRSPDLKTFFPLPHGNTVSPLPCRQVHTLESFVHGPDVIGQLVEFLGGGLSLYTSEDGIHFDRITPDLIQPNELPGEGSSVHPRLTFRIGDYRIYYYSSGDIVNYAYTKVDRETHYSLDAGETSGYLETPIIEQPEGGWEDLWVNVDPKGGQVRVAVIDPADESVVAGYGLDDCDAIADDVQGRLSWRGARFSELTQDHLRVRFEFQRPDTTAESPELYAWEIQENPDKARPLVTDAQVEAEANPANVTDAAPEFSWSYSDPNGLEQAAYHILVASSQDLLDENEGDMWDSGPISGSETTVEYDGEPLGELTTYVWKVRVRNAEGVWSEEW